MDIKKMVDAFGLHIAVEIEEPGTGKMVAESSSCVYGYLCRSYSCLSGFSCNPNGFTCLMPFDCGTFPGVFACLPTRFSCVPSGPLYQCGANYRIC